MYVFVVDNHHFCFSIRSKFFINFCIIIFIISIMSNFIFVIIYIIIINLRFFFRTVKYHYYNKKIEGKNVNAGKPSSKSYIYHEFQS